MINNLEDTKKIGVLLINLGTPKHHDPQSVRRYLSEFLNDPYVIDLNGIIRFLLVNALIVPFRYKRSAHAYRQIWQSNGSPLLINSMRLAHALSTQLGDQNYRVALGMRYGEPTIDSALSILEDCSHLHIIPLFPQYCKATTQSALKRCFDSIVKKTTSCTITIKPHFYDHSAFINAYANLIRQTLNGQVIDLLIFSYHGLPERQLKSMNCHERCDHRRPCPLFINATIQAPCYRAQCYETTERIAATLALLAEQYHTAFQSRLGRAAWIKPYTTELLPQLIRDGKRDIAVVSPSFVCDCLETLEEINLRLKAQWKALGGRKFIFIPALNDNPLWIEGFAQMIIGKPTFVV